MKTLEELYTELTALKLEIYLTKLEKKLAEKAETAEPSESEVKAKVWCYWNGEVVDCAELSKRLLIGGGCESDSNLSVSTSPSASEISKHAWIAKRVLEMYDECSGYFENAEYYAEKEWYEQHPESSEPKDWISVSTSPSASENDSMILWNGEWYTLDQVSEEMPDKQYAGDILSQALAQVSEPSQSKEDITRFFIRCANFDWFYSFSDSHIVWRNGEKNFKQLEEDSTQSPVFKKIFKDWREYIFSGESWGTVQPAKPEIASYI